MEPRIQYVKTSDGLNLAVSTTGSGPPLVVVPSWISHLELDQQELVKPSFFKRLGKGSRLVRYDKRGMGLSTRNVGDYSLDAQVNDLHAIIERLQLSGVTLFGSSQGGTICIAYAVHHPENVSRLILFGAYHHIPAAVKETLGAILPLVRTDWTGLGTSPMLEMFISGASTQTRDFFVHYQKEAANGEDAAAILEALAAYDVTSILPNIRVPTLVLHRRDDPAVSVDQGHEIASLIPNAQFVPLDGRIHLPYWGDIEPLIAAI
ncbi:MAG: alpha/beta hydrolase, partial [Chloroflexi bacterium]|nr:alpha/beta hydrolase [Chloroflexota bacterium]